MTTAKSSVTINGKRAVSSSKKKDHIKIDIVVDSSFSGSSEQDRYSASPNESVDLIDTSAPKADHEGHDCDSENGSTNFQEHNGQSSIESKDVNEDVSIGKGSNSRSGFHGFHLLVAAAEQSFCGTTTSSTLNNVEEPIGAKSVSYDEDDGGQNNSDSDEDGAVITHPETDYSSPSILMMERRLQVEKYNNRLASDKQNEVYASSAEATTGQEVSNGNKKRVTFQGTSSAEEEVQKEGQKRSKAQNGVDEEESDLNKRRRKNNNLGEMSPPPPVYHDRESDDYYRKQADLQHYREEEERRERRALMKHEGGRREREFFYHEDHEDPYYILRDEYGLRPHPHMSHEEHEQMLMRRDQLRYEHDVLRARKLLRRSQPPPPPLHLRSSYSAETGGEELLYDARPSRMLSPRLAPRDEYPPHEPSRGGMSIYHVPIVPPETSSRDLPSRSFHPENAPASSYRGAPPSFWHDGGRRERIAFRPESPSNAAAAYEARAASVAERIEAQEEYEREKRFMIQEQHDAAAAASWRRGGHHHHHPPSPSMSSYPPSAALVTPVHRDYATAPPRRYAPASHRRDRAAVGAIPPFPEKMFHPYARDELPPHHEYRERSSFHRHPDLGLVPINRSFPRSSGGRS